MEGVGKFLPASIAFSHLLFKGKVSGLTELYGRLNLHLV